MSTIYNLLHYRKFGIEDFFPREIPVRKVVELLWHRESIFGMNILDRTITCTSQCEE